jgi:general secretion pathway protein E
VVARFFLGPSDYMPVANASTPSTEVGPVLLADRVSVDFLIHHRICPVDILPNGTLEIAVAPDSLLGGLDDLSIAYDRPVATRLVTAEQIELLIAGLNSADEVPVELSSEAPQNEGFVSDIRDLANQPPVVRYVNLLIREAYESGASDIHLESTRTGVTARFRIDGVLQPGMAPPPRLDRAVVSRVKLLADLDIAERRRPQNGRIRVRLTERELDLRISTVPTVFGESLVLRLLERGGGTIALDDLGLPTDLLEEVRQLAQRPHGMILVTGPTGSGKTTTLYAALGLRSAANEKIITVEEPVEYALEGVTQVPVQVQTGVTFATMLRSILRQDPDVILVGEMRDTDTAELAIQAALTGHIVFSTLHTNDAVGAIPRLLDLGIPPFLVSATVQAVLAQRLVRRVCDACREAVDPTPEAMTLLGYSPRKLARGQGCETCRGTGYRGRMGVFELLVMTDDLRNALAVDPTPRRLENLARAQGMRPLREDGWAKVDAGLTTIEEVLRVTQE